MGEWREMGWRLRERLMSEMIFWGDQKEVAELLVFTVHKNSSHLN